MDNTFFADLVRSRHPMVPLIGIFNVQPASYIHPSRVEPFMPAALFEKLRHHARARRRLSRFLALHLGLGDQYCFDFQSERRRLALIDGPSLERLLLYAGLRDLSPAIARVIRRDERRRIVEQIGEDGYRFALSQAPFVASNLVPLKQIPQDLVLTARHLGRGYLERCFAGQPRALTQRLQLKLESSLRCDFERSVEAELGDRAFRLLRLLQRQVAPQWLLLFR